MSRSTPYGAFNFSVNLNSPGVDRDSELGGFSEVSGLVAETAKPEFRKGNARANHLKTFPHVPKLGNVTLKRGVVDSKQFFDWITPTREEGHKARRGVTITLKDETGAPVCKWKLQGVIPLKYTGPTLAGKGGDVAIEELVLSAEGLTLD